MLTYAPNNLIINSQTLTTQTIAVTVSNYILSFKGTGSVVMTGAFSGSLAGTGSTNRVFLKFTPTTGNLTITVTGTITEAQLERVTYETSPRNYNSTTTTAYYGPRFDYDPVTLQPKGFLIEEQRTNLLVRSEEFDNASWSKIEATITANAAISPDGTADAEKFIPSTNAVSHYVNQSVTSTTAQCTGSVYVKLDGSAINKVTLFPGSSGTFANFNLSTLFSSGEANVASTSITNVGNGWYRLSATWVAGITVTTLRIYASSGTFGAAPVAGDGTSGIFLYGAQLEAGAFATSYIPTVTSTVTRNADVASLQNTYFIDHYNPYAGTFIAQFQTLYSSNSVSNQGVLALNSNSNQRIMYLPNASSNIATYDGNTTLTASGDATGNIAKSAVAYDTESASLVLNGGNVVSANLLSTLWNGNSLNMGNTPNTFNGWLRNIKYYPSKLPNSQIKTLTS